MKPREEQHPEKDEPTPKSSRLEEARQILGSRYMTTAVQPPRRNIKPLTEKINSSKPGSPPAGSKAPQRDGLPGKIFHWDVIADGDCFLREGQVTVYDDGGCYFFGVTSTRDAGDVWLVKGLGFHDANGIELWRMPQFDGPLMAQDNTDYIFAREDLAYPAVYFPYITGVNMYHHC
jgi:Family of unknown function (DUF6294)